MRRLILILLMTATTAFGQQTPGNAVVDLLKQGQTVFGSMVSDKSEAGTLAMSRDPMLDFVFYDMERNYDLPTLLAFMKSFRAGGRTKAILVRIPPIGSEPDRARARVAELVTAGADGIVFPHVQNKQQAELIVEWLNQTSRGLWPMRADGSLVAYLMIEDREAVEHAAEIISTKGPTMFAPGQSSLGETYKGDGQAVETAIQTILSACKRANAVCAKLATNDIEQRIQQGFRVLMANGDALARGRKLAGRQF